MSMGSSESEIDERSNGPNHDRCTLLLLNQSGRRYLRRRCRRHSESKSKVEDRLASYHYKWMISIDWYKGCRSSYWTLFCRWSILLSLCMNSKTALGWQTLIIPQKTHRLFKNGVNWIVCAAELASSDLKAGKLSSHTESLKLVHI